MHASSFGNCCIAFMSFHSGNLNRFDGSVHELQFGQGFGCNTIRILVHCVTSGICKPCEITGPV